MFYKDQIVFHVTTQCPIVAHSSSDGRETHFIIENFGNKIEVFCPASIEAAKQLMLDGRIFPAPLPITHCHRCFNWLGNHHKNGSCWERKI